MCMVKRNSRWRRRRRGLTLMETVIAIIVLAVAIPPLLFTLSSGFDQHVDPIMQSRARWLAVEKLEDIIADRHSDTRGYSYVLGANYSAELSISGFPQFSRTVSINETQVDLTTPGSGYKVITVQVSWTDTSNVIRTLPVTTVLTEYDS